MTSFWWLLDWPPEVVRKFIMHLQESITEMMSFVLATDCAFRSCEGCKIGT